MKLRLLLACLSVVLTSAGNRLFATETRPTLEVPAYTAYSEPNPESLEISGTNLLKGWTDMQTTVAWYGLIHATGKLEIAVRLQLPAGETSRVHMKVGESLLAVKTIHGSGSVVTVSFGSIDIKQAGGYRFALSGEKRSGPAFGEIDALLLDGPAAKGAMFNLTEQRGAPSVHLNFPIPDGVQAKWFYNEVTVKTDPIWSYYEACGFRRGYFGIQVNSPTERRIIFSVWDSGKEPAERSKVAAEDRVQLLAKGPDVVASDFGNEGTGGHSHLVYPWKTGDTYRFLVSAQPDGTSTIYTGYFYFPEKNTWGLIASFRAPKDGDYLGHLYSFNEDFEGANGQQRRLAEFGNQWIKTTDGRWIELTRARFTHTARGLYQDRLDRGAGVTDNRFFLTNGGFKEESIRYNDEINRPGNGRVPDVELPSLRPEDGKR